MPKIKTIDKIKKLYAMGFCQKDICVILQTSRQYVSQVVKSGQFPMNDDIVKMVFIRDQRICRVKGCTQQYKQNDLTIHNLNEDQRVFTLNKMIAVCENCYQKLNP